MYPVLFQVGKLPIRSFSVLVMAGFLVGTWVWGKLLARFGADPKNDPVRASAVSVWLLVGVIGGARLMYVAVESARYLTADVTPAVETYLEAADRGAAASALYETEPEALEMARRLVTGYDFLHDPFQIIAVWQGGLVMYGGLFGAVLLGLWSARKQGMHAWNALDTGLVAGMVGLSIGRWGCLLVGDDYGKVVPERFRDLPFPITIQVPDLAWLRANPESLFDHDLAGEVLWATQPWMSVNALLVALAGLYVLQRRTWHGAASLWILFHYSISRFAIEFFRGDSVRGVWLDGALSTSQLVALPTALAAITLWLYRRGRAERIQALA